MTDLILSEDIYIPTFNDGKYIDEYPDTNKAFLTKYPNGIECPCSGKKYTSRVNFKKHTASKIHSNWLDKLIDTENNPLRKVFELEKTVRQQQLIIIRLENEKQRLIINKVPIGNLIDLTN